MSSRPSSRSNTYSPSRRPHDAFRLFLVTVTVAVAAGLSQNALAAPHEGPGMHGGMGMIGMGEGMGSPGMGGPGMGMMGMQQGGGHMRQMERMLGAVNATPDQRAQVRQIVQAAQGDAQGQHDATRKLREQGQALFVQPTVDARAVEAVRQQMLGLHDQASKRRMQVMLDVSRVFTVEQRKTLAERMTQRRAMMERHRSEREGMERAPR